MDEGSDLRCERPARKRVTYSDQERVTASTPTADLLDDLRGDR